jgi:hypothetical protein
MRKAIILLCLIIASISIKLSAEVHTYTKDLKTGGYSEHQPN